MQEGEENSDNIKFCFISFYCKKSRQMNKTQHIVMVCNSKTGVCGFMSSTVTETLEKWFIRREAHRH